jgi:hypothetical protein
MATAHTNANGHTHCHDHGMPRTYNGPHHAARIPRGVLNLKKNTANNLS